MLLDLVLPQIDEPSRRKLPCYGSSNLNYRFRKRSRTVWTNCAATCRHLWSRPAKTMWTRCCRWPSHSLLPSWWVSFFFSPDTWSASSGGQKPPLMTHGSLHFLTETCWRLQDDRPLQLRCGTAGEAAPVPGSGGRPVCRHGRERQFDKTKFKWLFCLVQCFWPNALHRQQGQSSSHCSFCIFLVKTLDKLLPKDRTEVCGCYEPSPSIHWRKILSSIPSSIFFSLSLQEAVIHLLEEICRIMPSSHRSQCEAVISTFSKTVLDAILSYATPQAVCSLLHQCKGQEAPLEGQSAVA